jgi:hypothetical protein
MDRVDERIGPALVCRLLNWEIRECGSMILCIEMAFISVYKGSDEATYDMNCGQSS